MSAPVRPAHNSIKGWNRFADLSQSASALILALLLALIAYGLYLTLPSEITGVVAQTHSGPRGYSDHALYRNIIHRMMAGQDYYHAVVTEHRLHHYPLHPFVAVRMPTLALVASLITIRGLYIVTLALAVLTIIIWLLRLGKADAVPWWARCGVVFVALNMSHAIAEKWSVIHETITGICVALAFALYRPDRQWLTFLLVAIALAIRETILPVAAVFGLFALIDRNWKMVAAWAMLGVAFLIGLTWHASMVSLAVQPNDLASPGWSGRGGWLMYLSFIAKSSILRFLPAWSAAIVVPLALLGWASWRARVAVIALAVQLVYMVIVMAFARENNFYWGMMFVPMAFLGLVFAPSALWVLVRRTLGVKRSTIMQSQ